MPPTVARGVQTDPRDRTASLQRTASYSLGARAARSWPGGPGACTAAPWQNRGSAVEAARWGRGPQAAGGSAKGGPRRWARTARRFHGGAEHGRRGQGRSPGGGRAGGFRTRALGHLRPRPGPWDGSQQGKAHQQRLQQCLRRPGLRRRRRARSPAEGRAGAGGGAPAWPWLPRRRLPRRALPPRMVLGIPVGGLWRRRAVGLSWPRGPRARAAARSRRARAPAATRCPGAAACSRRGAACGRWRTRRRRCHVRCAPLCVAERAPQGRWAPQRCGCGRRWCGRPRRVGTGPGPAAAAVWAWTWGGLGVLPAPGGGGSRGVRTDRQLPCTGSSHAPALP